MGCPLHGASHIFLTHSPVAFCFASSPVSASPASSTPSIISFPASPTPSTMSFAAPPTPVSASLRSVASFTVVSSGSVARLSFHLCLRCLCTIFLRLRHSLCRFSILCHAVIFIATSGQKSHTACTDDTEYILFPTFHSFVLLFLSSVVFRLPARSRTGMPHSKCSSLFGYLLYE